MKSKNFLTPLEKQVVDKFLVQLKHLTGGNFCRAVLFGSRARGESHPESDVDILVLLKAVHLESKHQIWDLANDLFLETEIDISPIVMSLESFEKIRNLERLFAKEIEQEGIPL